MKNEKYKLSEAARLLRNEYQRNYRKAHPGKDREAIARYWERKVLAAIKTSSEVQEEQDVK